MPWAPLCTPSLQAGTLAAYLRKNGFKAEALHLHLKIAAQVGLDLYKTIAYSTPPPGEAIFASILFPKYSRRLIEYAEKYIPNAKRLKRSLSKALDDAYANTNWSRYGLVGFTASYYQIFASLILCKWIKRDFPSIKTIMGGRLVSSEMGISLLRFFNQIDWCLDGEGELPLIELLRKMKLKKKDFELDVPGLIYRCDDKILKNPRLEMRKLSGLPDPDYDHYFKILEKHPVLKNSDIKPRIPIEESRGCRYRCAFCGDFSQFKGHRYRPPSEVASSVKRLSGRYKCPNINVVSLMQTPETCGKLFRSLAAHNRDYDISVDFRAEIPAYGVRMMKRAGVTVVMVGIEAMDTALLKKMNKQRRLIDNLLAMRVCEEYNIKNSYNLIIGFPTETQEDIDRSADAIDLALSYRPPASINRFRILDGAPVYKHPDRFGVAHIYDNAGFIRLLSPEMRDNMISWEKSFIASSKVRSYDHFQQRVAQWRVKYDESRLYGQPLLYYLNCGSFLTIYDDRNTQHSFTLHDWVSDLYTYCHRIRSMAQIKRKFPRMGASFLSRELGKLCDLKLMHSEDNDFLSLAIPRASV